VRKNLGLNIGTYTSPHLISETERVKINNNPVTYTDLESFLPLDNKLNTLSSLSYFEFFTLYAIWEFNKRKCDLEIYEAGLGGRLDATKLTKAENIVITKIGLDHTSILGDSKEKILTEKLGICTDRTRRIFYFSQDLEVLNEMIQDFAKTKNIELHCFPYKMTQDYLEYNLQYAKFIAEKIYQKRVESLSVPPPLGRMQEISNKPLRIFDVGHNPQAIEALLFSLSQKYKIEKWDVLLGCLPDKNMEEIVQIIYKWNKLRKIYIYASPPFQEPKSSNWEVFSDFDKEHPCLITGSFRLYEAVFSKLN
jgi:dihydrofolate synthase / folylpolyglutamate synthase